MQFVHFIGHYLGRPGLGLLGGGGVKNPPSAPPAIPPIIINPFNYQTPGPAIDPRITPPGPPVAPPRQPDWHFARC